MSVDGLLQIKPQPPQPGRFCVDGLFSPWANRCRFLQNKNMVGKEVCSVLLLFKALRNCLADLDTIDLIPCRIIVVVVFIRGASSSER